MTGDLDTLSHTLSEARSHVVRTLVVAASYVDRQAASGDLEAQELSRLIRGAFDLMTCVNLDAVTILKEHRS
jgi:hypothetical protein